MQEKYANPPRAVILILSLAVLIAPSAGAFGTSTQARADSLIARGIEDLHREDFKAAVDDFSKAVALRSDGPGYFLLGYAHYQRGFKTGAPETADQREAQETINAYKMALSLDPKLKGVKEPFRLYHGLGLAYEAMNAPDSALGAYKLAISAAPGNPMLPLYVARLRHKLGELSRSTADLALSLRKAKRKAQAAQIAALVKTDPMFSILLQNPANLKLLRKYDRSLTVRAPRTAKAGTRPELRDSVREGAAGENRKRLKISEQAREVMTKLAAAEEDFRFRRYREALGSYGDALALNERTPTLSLDQTALILEKMGTSHGRLGQAEQAVDTLRRSLRALPSNASAYYQLALVYSVSGRYFESLRALSDAFKAASSPAELRKFLLLAKADVDLQPVRDLPGFEAVMTDCRELLARR